MNFLYSSRAALPELEALHRDPDDLVVVAAMYGSWQLGLRELPTERIVIALASHDKEIVQESVHALCRMGEPIVPKLVELLEVGSAHADKLPRILSDIGGSKSRAAVEVAAESSDAFLAGLARELLEDWD